jgi:hypothetical protein
LKALLNTRNLSVYSYLHVQKQPHQIKLYLIVVVLQMQENPAPHTDFAGVGVRQGIWYAGFFCTRVP